jgi:50S ribosomal protein L16 3-hydroxylase
MIDPVPFLKRYWQKRPLLMRGAFPKFRDPVTRDELAGLSCESDVESRLVMERGGAKPWQVTPGPQQAARLRRLPRSHWTLLVQNVDRFVPGVAALLAPFRFIPDWRVDDVMVSFAPKGGGVGPHVDSYDVFLLQGQGRRRWRIARRGPRDLRPGLDLRILRHFHAEDEWILNPGDLLYLPPGVAHEGVALEECLTYSIGLRAPSLLELLAATQQRLAQEGGAAELYRDPRLAPARLPGEVSRAAVRRMRRLLEGGLRRLGEADFDALVGELLTDPKGAIVSAGRRVSASTLKARLKKGSVLVRSPESRLVFLRRGGATDLFADGRRFPLGPQLAFAAPLLTSERRLPAPLLTPHLKKRGFVELLAALTSAGAFRFEA